MPQDLLEKRICKLYTIPKSQRLLRKNNKYPIRTLNQRETAKFYLLNSKLASNSKKTNLRSACFKIPISKIYSEGDLTTNLEEIV